MEWSGASKNEKSVGEMYVVTKDLGSERRSQRGVGSRALSQGHDFPAMAVREEPSSEQQCKQYREGMRTRDQCTHLSIIGVMEYSR